MFTKLCPFDLAKMLESSINTYTIIDIKISVTRMYVTLLSEPSILEYQGNKMTAAHAEPLTSMNAGID